MKGRQRATRHRVHPIHEEVANIGDQVSSLGEKLGQDASEETQAAIRSIREALDRIADDARDLTRAGVGELRETIQENSFTGVVIGIGIGFMLAVMLRR
jgi:ElaB/YqjD/DUF883 family membrane-anchored ribosome-binding protein